MYKSDTILPKTKKKTHEYWKNKLPKIQAIIANPPWSSEKIYTRDELHQAGFSLTDGQYDSYVLFIELAYKLLQNNGYFAFIIPDSIFDNADQVELIDIEPQDLIDRLNTGNVYRQTQENQAVEAKAYIE